jgi:MFS family permease
MLEPNSFAAARAAIAIVFFVNGFAFATWVSRIPAVRDQLSLTEGQLGTALFGLAAGALVAFPLAGRATAIKGARAVTLLSGLVYCLALPGPALAGGLALLVLSLFVFGAANGAMDVSMNALAVEVEALVGRPIMSSLHGMWSAGGLAGAVAGSFFAKQAISPELHLLVASGLLVATLLISKRWLPASRTSAGQSAPHFVRPEAAMVGLGIIIFCSFLIEGAMADWSAVLLRDSFNTSEATAALGYAAFSLAMMSMRFAGDRVITRWNAKALLRSTNTIGAMAFGAALWLQNVELMLIALALVGFGTATVAPLVFREAGKRARSGAANGIAAMATVGYGGFLVGPPFVGWIAEVSTLRAALSLLVLLALTIAVLAYHVRER